MRKTQNILIEPVASASLSRLMIYGAIIGVLLWIAGCLSGCATTDVAPMKFVTGTRQPGVFMDIPPTPVKPETKASNWIQIDGGKGWIVPNELVFSHTGNFHGGDPNGGDAGLTNLFLPFVPEPSK